jgi:2-polyprenyl-3-methyl-5-hydroxy-6-metoxy-1,4-benzoquinol methylase
MMEPNDTGRAYDQIAHLWQHANFNQQNGIAQHQRALAFLGENKNGASRNALDVGCGSNERFHELLRQAGMSVTGIDISERMLTLARQKNPSSIFHHADICEWQPPDNYHLITAWDSIWHVPLDKQASVMQKLMGHLHPGGVLIFTMPGLDHPVEKTDDAMGPEVYYSSLGIPRLLALANDLSCNCRHLEFDQYPELHLFVILQKDEATAKPGAT